MKIQKLWRNWTFHNLVSHPMSEVAYWCALPFGQDKATSLSGWIHDMSLPVDDIPTPSRG